MRHQFSVRFQPASGAKFVQAQAYIRALQATLEGLTSLRASLAPELAAKHGWALPQVRDALTFSIGPTGKGSLIVPLIAGGGVKGAPLASDLIAQAFWSETAAELARVPKGQAPRLSASGADAFARASAAAKESAATLSFVSKTSGGSWNVVAGITRMEASLRKHAVSQRKGQRATTSISGQIVSLTYDPPGFILATSGARRSVQMPSALRNRARELWGQEVVVLTDAVVTAEGDMADLHAADIRAAKTAQMAEERFDETFGVMRGSWDSEELASDLGRSSHH
ncbi:MAG: hypothetical protein SFV15_13850 [Polyangiaceae bacterium]|nr:hypothetical protein [Polyangiaceae bacterium]